MLTVAGFCYRVAVGYQQVMSLTRQPDYLYTQTFRLVPMLAHHWLHSQPQLWHSQLQLLRNQLQLWRVQAVAVDALNN